MSKLYFRYGAVSSAKTLNLLAVAHTYKQQGKKVVVLKPALDVRFGKSNVKSRAGLDREADFLLEPKTVLPASLFDGCHCVLVDEAQFVSNFVIDQLRHICTYRNVPVIAYGLKVDFRTQLFEGSKRLFEVADSIEEVKTTCYFCNKKAIYNLKSADGKPTLDGPQRTLGCEELYLGVCAKHFNAKLNLESSPLQINSILKAVDYENAVALVAAAVAEKEAEGEEEEGQVADLDSSAEADKLAEELKHVIDLSDDVKV